MKRIKWLFGLCLMVLVVCGSGVQAADAGTDSGTEESDFLWSENEDGTVTIYDYRGTNETVVVPSEIDGKPVKSIGATAFSWNEGYSHKVYQTIKHVVILEGVIDIQDGEDLRVEGAFVGCENLETVSLPSTLKKIGYGAFVECDNLREINLSEGLTSIGDYAFYECYNLNNIILPNGMVSIGKDAFFGCSSIEKLVVPDSVTYIGENAFGLSTGYSIPIYGNPDAYVKTYADANKKIIFSCLNHPNIVDVPAVAPNCRQYGKTAGTRCTVCGSYVIKPQEIRPNGQHIWEVKKFRNATVRRVGEKISVCTVRGCGVINVEKIPKLALPQKGETVTESTSDDSYKVTKPSVKNGMVELSKADKTKSNVSVPDTITVDGVTYKVISISKDTFKGNKRLKKVTIGKNVTKINANAFNGCKNLKNITVKSTQIKTVGKNAFKGINAKAKIKVPKSKLRYYKKLFAKKGLKSTVKIVK